MALQVNGKKLLLHVNDYSPFQLNCNHYLRKKKKRGEYYLDLNA